MGDGKQLTPVDFGRASFSQDRLNNLYIKHLSEVFFDQGELVGYGQVRHAGLDVALSASEWMVRAVDLNGVLTKRRLTQ